MKFSTRPCAAAACCAYQSISDLFTWPKCLANSRGRAEPELTILTNAGGPGVLATDALLANGGELLPLSEERSRIRSTNFFRRIGATAIRSTSLATPLRTVIRAALEIAAKDPNSDGLLVILAPQGMTDPEHVAEASTPYANIHRSRCWPRGWAESGRAGN